MTKRRVGEVAILVALLVALAPLPALPAQIASVEPALWQLMQPEGQAGILVILKEQADLGGALALATKEEKGWYVYHQLTAVAERSQPPLRDYLDRQGIAHRSYWIRNMISVEEAGASLIRELARRPDVDRIEVAQPDGLIPLVITPSAFQSRPVAVEWNIQRLHADDVWAMGVEGAGTVVGIIDSGVDWHHPALVNAYREWVPGAPSRHDYNWYDGPGGSQTPVDYSGHGTAVTGIIVGDDGMGNQIGMAPGADWIACNMLPPTSNAFDCLQFMLAPTRLDGSEPRPDLAPHVLSNSWRAGADYSDIIHTLYLAGIMFVKAGENEGPNCGTVHTPGHLREVTAVGAFAQGDVITSFSSRGPMMLNGETITKPDVAAPGLNCRTSYSGGGYGDGKGTSIACPHVTGTVLLILSARPDLAGRIDTLQMLLNETAEPQVDLQCPPNDPSGVPNNVWGHGIVNALDAVLLAQSLGMGGIQGQVTDADTGQPIASASIGFEDAGGRQFLGTDVLDGAYAHTLPAAIYTATVETYGYYPGVAGGVVVSDGGLTAQDLSLVPRPTHVVSGTVTRNSIPLSATLAVLHTPLDPVQTDPATGAYAITVTEGAHVLRVEAFQHLSQVRAVVVDGDRTEKFGLERIPYIPIEGNPILQTGAPGAWDADFVGGSNVLHVGGIYYLFYMGANSLGNYGAIGYATSTDGINYTKYTGNPILAGDGSGFDADFAGYPVVVYAPPEPSTENDYWTIYYAGQAIGGQLEIGRATAPSPSGPWTRGYFPVLSVGSFWEWDGEWIAPDSVISTGGGYVMYYTGDSYPGISSKVGLATSVDGVVWTKYDDPSTPGSPFAESDPVLWASVPRAWDERLINLCEARATEDGWEMYYSGYDRNLTYLATGYATSPDGVHWTKDTRNPILHPKDDPAATRWLRKPTVAKVGDMDWMYHDNGADAINAARRLMIPPVVAVGPLSLEASLCPDEQVTQTLTISNIGGLALDFYLSEMSGTVTCDLSWLSQHPIYGTIPSGEGQFVDVVYDAIGLTPSVYLGLLDVATNDPDAPSVGVQVTLTVECAPEWWPVWLPLVVKDCRAR